MRVYPSLFFVFYAPATTEIHTLSLHDALPIWHVRHVRHARGRRVGPLLHGLRARDRKSTRLNSSHRCISYAVFCLKKKKHKRSRKASVGYKVQRTINASRNAATSKKAHSSTPH